MQGQYVTISPMQHTMDGGAEVLWSMPQRYRADQPAQSAQQETKKR
jgi:hypothetical protein